MKGLLAFCLVVYFVSEISAKPSQQTLDGVTDFFDSVKTRVQEAMDQARDAATRAMETARDAMQSGFQSVQGVAQSRMEPNKQSQSETEVVEENGATK